MKKEKPPTRWNSTIRVTPRQAPLKNSHPKRFKPIRKLSPSRSERVAAQRKGKPKAVNVARRKRERERSSGPKARRTWLHEQPCVITGQSPVEEAHVRCGGGSRKADAKWTVPMIGRLHHESHTIGIKSFEAKYGVDLDALAIETERRWQEHTNRSVA